MTRLNARDRDEFLKALEEARRAALGEGEEVPTARARPASGPPLSAEFLRVIDHMAGKVRSYVSSHLLSRLYAENTVRPGPDNDAQPPPLPPKSDHDAVMEELHLTPGLTAHDLVRLRREFAKSNHPDMVPSPARDAATRRMTIANSIIDEALRSKKPRPQ